LLSRSNRWPSGRLEVDVEAVRAAQRLVVEEQVEHHLRERHRDHDEVDAVGAHHEEADDQRSQPRGQHGHRQGPPQADGLALRREEGQRVARQAEVGRVAQRHQAGHALQQIQAHGEDRQDHHARDHLRVEIGAHEGEGQQRDRAQPSTTCTLRGRTSRLAFGLLILLIA
jgi:hypothetical protein